MDRCCMLLCFFAILGLALANEYTAIRRDSVDDATELSEIKASLAQLQDSNRRLERQNRRLQQVWTGLGTMCSTILDGCECKGETEQVQVQVTPVPEGEHVTSTGGTGSEDVYEAGFRLEGIVSTGIMDDDIIDVTVIYEYNGTDRIFTDWRLQRGAFRTATRRSGKATVPITEPGASIMSTFRIVSPGDVNYFEFLVASSKEELNAVFNVSALYEAGSQIMTPWNVTIRLDGQESNQKLVSPETDDFRFNVTVEGGGTELSGFEVHFMGTNTSAAVPVAFEASTWQEGDITVTRVTDGPRATPESSLMVAMVEIRNRFSKFGGLLEVRVHRGQGRYTKRDGYAIIRDVLPTGAEEIIPFNTHAFFTLPKQVMAISSEVSVVCGAMGNPQPRLTIEKSEKPSQTLDADVIYQASFLTVISLTMNSTDKKIAGKYVCKLHDVDDSDVVRATTSYDVIIPKEFEFHEYTTGVMENSSKTIMVSCTASGKPRPELGLNLYQKYGPDVAKSGLYPVSRTYPSADTARIQMTITPVNPDITTLYCVAGHPDFEPKFYKIELFPVTPDWHRNWELYDQIRNMTRYND